MSPGRSISRAAIVAALMLAGSGVSTLAQEKDRASQYARLMQEVDGLERYNTERQRLLQEMADEMTSLQDQANGLEATAAAVNPLLEKMYDSLSRFVEEDLPFLPDERRERMNRLSDLMAQDGALSEKYRRLVEAYQIELEYGRTLGTYQGKLDDGRDADFIYLGRVSLMYRTVDGAETGYWDAGKRSWVAAPDDARLITEILGIAEEKTAPDIIVVPVPTAREARS